MVYRKNADDFLRVPDVVASAGLGSRHSCRGAEHHAWLINVPGAKEIVVEVLPGSTWPAVLSKRGYDLTPGPGGERILPSAIVETDLIKGSTATRSVTHTGICKMRRFSLRLP